MIGIFKHLSEVIDLREYINKLAPPIEPKYRLRDTSVTATAESVTFTAGGYQMKIGASDYDIFFRWLTDTDTAAVTASNFWQFVKAGSAEYHIIPTGKTGISYFAPSGTATLQLLVL